MSHVVPELSALLDGALDAAARRSVEAHLAGCPACRAEHRRLQGALAALARLPAAPEPSPWFDARLAARLAQAPRRGLLGRLTGWRLVVPAGGLAAAALAGVLVIRQQRGLELEAATQLDLLTEYETVASVDDVATPEDVAIIAQLDTLERDVAP
jgi:anti-sigma factor RsiW